MYTICPNEGAMAACKKKPRCAWGACEGQSLPSDPEDYCPSGYEFREDYCDCITGCSKYWLVTSFAAGVVEGSNCGGACNLTGAGYFFPSYITMPFPVIYTGTFHHTSASEFCNGPVNCDRTPASYGVDLLYLPSGIGYSLRPGGLMSCGTVDEFFAVFEECNVDSPRIFGFLLAAAGVGGTDCSQNVFSISSVEPTGINFESLP